MATFTIELWRVNELTKGDFGLKDYHIFDEDYREPLNKKILDHYYNREIGMESVDMFRLAMRRRMNEIMPLYNKLYDSEKIEFDPLSTVDIRTVSTGTAEQETESEGNSTTESTSLNTSRAINSDTPQTMLSGNGDYATSGADVRGDGEAASTGEESGRSTTDSEHSDESQTSGYQGIASELLMRYRQSLLNIDLMVLNELEDLFMLVWDNGDAYTQNNGRWFL